MNTYVHRIATHVINYVSLHIFLTLVSLPIIVAWGLPSSWLSPVGNFIFNPFISLFLFIASVSFFSEIINVPHAWCNGILEYITSCWQWVLPLAPSCSLYGFHYVPWWLLTIIAGITFMSVMHPRMRRPIYRCCGLTLLFIIAMVIIRAHEPSVLIHTMPCNKGSITIIRMHNKTMVIDPGYIGSRLSARSWIAYTFMPELIGKTGSLTIDHLMLLKPTILTFDALDELLDHASVKHVYIPSMEGELTGTYKRSFGKAYAHMKRNNVAITRLTTKPVPIGTHLSITPQGTKPYKTITYPHSMIEGMVDNTPIHIIGR